MVMPSPLCLTQYALPDRVEVLSSDHLNVRAAGRLIVLGYTIIFCLV